MKCQKTTKIKEWLNRYTKRCNKEAVLQDNHGRWLCQHHLNKHNAKLEKSTQTK